MADTHCARLLPLRILTRKWSYLTLRALRTPLTFSELQKELRYITNHILTRELRLLHSEGLITSQKKYGLTPNGKTLLESVEPLVSWSVKHCGKEECPQDKKCSTCSGYPVAIGAHSYAQKM